MPQAAAPETLRPVNTRQARRCWRPRPSGKIQAALLHKCLQLVQNPQDQHLCSVRAHEATRSHHREKVAAGSVFNLNKTQSLFESLERPSNLTHWQRNGRREHIHRTRMATFTRPACETELQTTCMAKSMRPAKRRNKTCMAKSMRPACKAELQTTSMTKSMRPSNR